MKGYNKWSYSPYHPFFFDVGEIYICRIAPSENSIHIEWRTEASLCYSVYFKQREESDYTLAGTTRTGAYDISGLREGATTSFTLKLTERRAAHV